MTMSAIDDATESASCVKNSTKSSTVTYAITSASTSSTIARRIDGHTGAVVVTGGAFALCVHSNNPLIGMQLRGKILQIRTSVPLRKPAVWCAAVITTRLRDGLRQNGQGAHLHGLA